MAMKQSWIGGFRATLPAVVLALFAFWAGTVAGGATARGAVVGQAALLGGVLVVAWIGGLEGLDPLGLGRRGRWLVGAVWVAAAASLVGSPVERAGVVAVALLPAFLALPRAVRWAWAGEAGRRWGVRGVAAAVGLAACWSLASRFLAGAPRAADPIGHHGLLAVWMLALVPLAALAVRERGRWRVLGLAAGLGAVAALAAGGSLAGWLGLLTEVALLILWMRSGSRLRRWAAAGAAVMMVAAVASQGPRLAGMASATDTSLRARWVYAAGGWRGFVERPALGWGPGSTAWTLAEWLRPIPGVNPPGEVVAELHALPVRVLYELGGTGAALALALGTLFVRRRLGEIASRSAVADPSLARAGLAGLAGAGVALLGTAWLEVTALPVALAVAAGAALAGSARRSSPEGGTGEVGVPRAGVRWRWGPALAGGYVLAVALLLLPVDRAQFAYERGVGAQAGSVAARRAFAAAARLDPRFPLYRAVLAWSLETPPVGPRRLAVEEARRAADGAPGIAPFWLTAGVYGADAGAPWAAAALDRACDLDPLGALAPFYRMTLDATAPRAAEYGARALLAAPALAAATYWEGREDLFGRAVADLAGWPGVDAGWRQALVDAVTGWDVDVNGTVDRLALRVDPTGAASLPLRVFRRRPHPVWLVPVEIRRELAAQLRIPAAAAVSTTSPAAFAGPGCGRPR